MSVNFYPTNQFSPNDICPICREAFSQDSKDILAHQNPITNQDTHFIHQNCFISILNPIHNLKQECCICRKTVSRIESAAMRELMKAKQLYASLLLTYSAFQIGYRFTVGVLPDDPWIYGPAYIMLTSCIFYTCLKAIQHNKERNENSEFWSRFS